MKLLREADSGHLEVDAGRDDLLAVNGALGWVHGWLQADIPGLDRGAARALQRRVHESCDCSSSESTPLVLSWVELRAFETVLSGMLDEFESSELHTLTGVSAATCRRTLDEITGIAWMAP